MFFPGLPFAQALVDFVQALEGRAVQGVRLEKILESNRSLIHQEILQFKAIEQ